MPGGCFPELRNHEKRLIGNCFLDAARFYPPPVHGKLCEQLIEHCVGERDVVGWFLVAVGPIRTIVTSFRLRAKLLGLGGSCELTMGRSMGSPDIRLKRNSGRDLF